MLIWYSFAKFHASYLINISQVRPTIYSIAVTCKKYKYLSLFITKKTCRTVLLLCFCFTTEQSTYTLHQLFSLSFSLLASWRLPKLWWGLQSTQQRRIALLQHQSLPALPQQRGGICSHQQLSPLPAHQNQKQSKVRFSLCLHYSCDLKGKTQLVNKFSLFVPTPLSSELYFLLLLN